MDLTGRQVALYGRFTPGVRDRLQQRVLDAGGSVARDLTRHGDLLVVGALATTLIDSGALATRLAAAANRAPVLGERAFVATLDGETVVGSSTLPLTTALAQTALTPADAALLAAFDLIGLEGDNVRFGDAGTLRTAAELIAAGRSRAETVRILAEARDLAPRGRHRIVLTGGEAALEWHDGRRTTLRGQGTLPLGDDHPGVDDLFEAAALAEAEGDLATAARLYDQCARADRADPIAPYNLGNIRLGDGQTDPRAHDDAALAYRQALARDPGFVEARYNLAQALEASGKADEAAAELAHVLTAEPAHADATFNLAQLRMSAGDMAGAKDLYERYLSLGPPDAWAATARKAILYCSARLIA